LQINVHGRHGRVPVKLQRFAVDKLEHLGRYLSTITTIDVELFEDGKHKAGDNHVVHVTVSANGPVFRSRVTSTDPHACIDIAAGRLERSIKEFKRKRSGKPAHSRPKVESPDNLKEASPDE